MNYRRLKKVAIGLNCMACGICESINDEIFSVEHCNEETLLKANHLSEVQCKVDNSKIKDENKEDCFIAKEACPMGNIEIVEDE